MPSTLARMAYIQQQNEAGLARGKENRLAGLYQQALSSPRDQRQGVIAQMAGVNPQAAFDANKHFESFDENGRQRLGQYASAFDALPDDMKAQAYPQLAKQAQELGIPAPPEWNPAYAPHIQKLAQSLGGGAAGGRVQSRFVGEDGQIYALMSDSTVKPLGIKADPNTQIVEGQGGFYGVDKRTLGATPVQIGQPPARQQAPSGREMPFTIDPSLPPEIQADIRSVEASGQPWTQAPMQTQQPSRQLAPTGPAPSPGYQWNADRTAMIPIPGGPADKPAPTAGDFAKDEMSMRKELADLNKQPRIVMDMYRKVEAAAKAPSAPNDLAMIFAYMKMLDPGSVVREQEFANAQNAAGIPDQVRNAWNKALNGQRLNENQRREFLQSAAQIASLAQNEITTNTRQKQSEAEQYGYDPVRASGVPDFRNVTSGGPTPQQQDRRGGDVGDLLTKYGVQ